MVYKFKLVSEEVSNFCREIEIDADANFLVLRNAILDSVGYTKDELSSFFICDDDWEKREEITLEDMGTDSDQDIWIMEDTHINELVEDEGQRLLFMFDYMTERCFYMELKKIIPHKSLLDPVCTRKEGKAAPQQIDFDALEAATLSTSSSSALDLDFEESDGFDDEELPEGIAEFDD